jgi:hypothetical protein
LYLTLNEADFFLTGTNPTKSGNYLHQNLCILQNTELINVHKFDLIYILDSEYLKKYTGNQYLSSLN